VNFTFPGATVENLIILPDVPLTVTGDAIGFDGASASVVFVVAGRVVATVVILTIFCAGVTGIAGVVMTVEVIAGVTFTLDSLTHPAKNSIATRKTIKKRYLICPLFI
jgi:hypothetical protein